MRSKLGAILLLALALRLGAAFAVQTYLDQVAHREFLIPGDAEGYWELGQKLAAGEPYEIYSPPRRIMRMPGFPLLLAAFIKIGGPSLFFARVMLAVCGTAACAAVYWLGRIVISESVGLLAALLAAISPTFIGFSIELLSETPFALALTLSLVYMTKVRNEPSIRWAVMAGIWIAIATYMRPTWLLVAPLFAMLHVLAAIWKRQLIRQALRDSAIVVAVCGCLLLPWTIRNYALADEHIVPTTLWVGPSLYDGLHPHATGDSNMQFFEDDRLMALGRSEYQMDHEYRRRAWAYARENPGRAFELGLIKLWRYWSPWPNAAQFRHWWMALPIGAFGVFMLGCSGIAIWYSRGQVTLMMLTLGPAVYFAAIHALFVGSVRYRLPAEYPLMVLAAAGLLTVRNKVLRQGSRCAEHSVENPEVANAASATDRSSGRSGSNLLLATQ